MAEKQCDCLTCELREAINVVLAKRGGVELGDLIPALGFTAGVLIARHCVSEEDRVGARGSLAGGVCDGEEYVNDAETDDRLPTVNAPTSARKQ